MIVEAKIGGNMGRKRKCFINHTLNNDNPGKGFYLDINHCDIERPDINRYDICFNHFTGQS